ncbi:odorant receptor 177 [Nasonia vitripennis]|uniref:Odorant receptor n=1 Tax=Nasonia vitripennis TaxID=7425 RepID=A0A7M6UMR4_NASVI|nr:odorant receptor 177 [Nasonia vitripennis]
MDLFDGQYFKLNKIFLTICGLWPYQSKLRRRITFAMLASSTLLFIFTLVAGILSQSKFDFVNTEETFIFIFYCSAGLLKCTILYNQQNKIKKLYERIATDWKQLTDTSERDILRSFLLEGRKLNFIIMISCSSAFIIYSCVDLLPRILKEKSEYHRPHSFPYYFRPMVINEKLYDLQVAVHITVIVFYAGFAYMSAIATYISSVKHVCALYEIARYRLQNAVSYDKSNNSLLELVEDTSIVPKLVKVIDMHAQALRGIQIIEKVFSADFFVLEASSLTALATDVYELKYCRANVRTFIRAKLLTPIVIIYLFFVNCSGEQVIQACNDMRITAYYIDWYRTSSRARVFVLMIMRRTLNPKYLTAGTIVMIISIENFAAIITTAWSIGTILLTT